MWWARRRLDLARYWHAHADLDEAARHGYQALQLVRDRPGIPATLTALAALTVGQIERDRARFPLSDAHLAVAVELLDAEPADPARDRLLGRALTDLGDALRRGGRYRQAAPVLERARRLLETTDGAHPTALAAVLTAEAIMAKELGQFDRAANLYARVHDIQDRADTPAANAATLLHNLAGLAYARQHHAQAEAYARRAVTERHTAAGPHTVEVAADLAVLAAAVAAQCRHDEARTHLNEALAICRAARPPRDYEIAVQQHTLAAVDHADGRLDAAEHGYRQALAAKQRLLGPDHPEIAALANNLGTLLHETDRDAEAAEYYRHALSIAERTYGPAHPTTVAIGHNATLTGRPSRPGVLRRRCGPVEAPVEPTRPIT
jgi:tetratricopeptide (TPR) repeat protein